MTGCPFITDRRRLLMGLGLGAIGTLAPAAQAREAAQPNVDDAPHGHAETAAQSVPFHGPHQAGIVTPRPANGIVAAFDVVAASLDDVETMLRLLTERAAFLTQGGAVPERDPRLPRPIPACWVRWSRPTTRPSRWPLATASSRRSRR